MPNAPPLTELEDEMLKRVRGLEKDLAKNGKRIKQSLKENIDKFRWREGDKVWGSYSVILDKSAENVLANEVELDTYEISRLHQKDNGNLPKVVRKNVGGTRSFHYGKAVRLPRPAKDRLFENWFTWKEVKLSNGKISYLVGFVPLKEYPGKGFVNFSKEGFKIAEATGVYIISEVAPNVCRVTRIQSVDLKFEGLQKVVMDMAVNYLAKSQLFAR